MQNGMLWELWYTEEEWRISDLNVAVTKRATVASTSRIAIAIE